MRHDLRALLAQQAAWQRSRAEQSWAEKLRLSILMREDLRPLRKPNSQKEENRSKSKEIDWGGPVGREVW